MTVTRELPRQRRQTLAFLRDARSTAHVDLSSELDMSAVRSDRRLRAEAGNAVSYVSYVVKAAGEVLASYPEARSVLSGRLRPRITHADTTTAKVLFDKWIDGQRCVLSGIVTAQPDADLDFVQREVESFRDDKLEVGGRFGDLLRLQRLPVPVIGLLYRVMMAHPRRRLERQGTFSVTSVGHEAVRCILPMITGTLGFGVGQILDRPVVRDGDITVAPVMTLSLTFDHRVIDGAMAAEILGRIKSRLENWC